MAKASTSGCGISSKFIIATLVVFFIFLLALGSDGRPATADANGEPQRRVRKHAADQRFAELQALAAEAANNRILYGHGLVDPESAGRRKRLRGPELFEDHKPIGHSRRLGHLIQGIKPL